MNIFRSLSKLRLDSTDGESPVRSSKLERAQITPELPAESETINPELEAKPTTPVTPSVDQDDIVCEKKPRPPSTPAHFDEFSKAKKRPVVVATMKQSIVLPTNRPHFGITEDLQSLLHCTRNVEDIKQLQPALSQEVRPDTYIPRFRLLIQVEEYEEMINRKPVIRNIVLGGSPAGSGRRDFVVHCDARDFRHGQKFFFRAANSPRKVYEGKVISTRRDQGCVVIRLAPPKVGDALLDPLEKFDMIAVTRFNSWYGRLQGILLRVFCHLGHLVLFPLPKPFTYPKPLPYPKHFDKGLDQSQQDAVFNILERLAAPAPYLLLGPPGTGKTRTVAEAIRQVVFRNTWSRVLVCGFTLNSVRVLFEKVTECEGARTLQVLILVVSKQELERLPPAIQQSAVIVNSQMSETIHQRLIFSTYSTIGVVTENFSFAEGHFSHVFIDDATMITEPECLMPLSVLGSSKDSQIVLTGDICGLLPQVRSDIAHQLGLDCSLPLRLLNRPAYSNQDPRYVTVLRKNYRSSPQIMSTSSAVLYDSEMTFSGRYEAENSPLPPLQFIQVDGIVELRVLGGVASYANVIEMRAVVQQVQSFYAAGLKPQEVGVFSPAVRQLQIVRDELLKINIPVPVIGHVDEFVGGEVIALLISCVQSYSEWAKKPEDVVGFIGHPELSNFAISRARGFVSIVGNLKCLHREDLFWRLFLRDANRKGYLSLDRILTMPDL